MPGAIGNRFKTNYENPYRVYLTRRTPVVIRVDGRAFHTFTRQFEKPFSYRFIEAMQYAAMIVMEEMQGFKLGYIQSDEVSFVLTDYDTMQTQPWFGYNKSKIETTTASLMTAYFGRALRLMDIKEMATFDARAFNVPESEVVNYFLWRALDWNRNSIQMYAQSIFSHAELQGKSCADIHDMLHARGRDWAHACSDVQKNGTFIIGPGCEVREDVRPTYPDIAKLWERVAP